jgi:hypothetical protein
MSESRKYYFAGGNNVKIDNVATVQENLHNGTIKTITESGEVVIVMLNKVNWIHIWEVPDESH